MDNIKSKILEIIDENNFTDEALLLHSVSLNSDKLRAVLRQLDADGEITLSDTEWVSGYSFTRNKG